MINRTILSDITKISIKGADRALTGKPGTIITTNPSLTSSGIAKDFLVLSSEGGKVKLLPIDTQKIIEHDIESLKKQYSGEIRETGDLDIFA